MTGAMMLALWEISTFPKCRYHVFLSHCAEDREWLVVPLLERLQRRQIVAWIDRDHYGPGGDPYEKLRENILLSRHTVFLITEGMLSQSRGWTALEKAYAGLLQDNLRCGATELCRVELPLLFLAKGHDVFPRTVWLPLESKGVYHGTRDGEPLDWAEDQIVRFVYAEARRGLALGEALEQDPRFNDKRPGLADRVSATYPSLDPMPTP